MLPDESAPETQAPSHAGMQQTLQVRCEAFSAALVQGQKPELEAHLRSCPKELRLRLFPLLLKLELLHFQKAGQPVASSHYHRRFPKLAAVIDQVIESLPQDFKGTLSQPSQNSTNEDTLAIGGSSSNRPQPAFTRASL